jgi:hypothetical protein
MIFCKRKGGQQYELKLYGSNIEIVESYSYIRLTFTYNGKLTLVKKKLAEQAQKRYMLFTVKLEILIFQLTDGPVHLVLNEHVLFTIIDQLVMNYIIYIYVRTNKYNVFGLHVFLLIILLTHVRIS